VYFPIPIPYADYRRRSDPVPSIIFGSLRECCPHARYLLCWPRWHSDTHYYHTSERTLCGCAVSGWLSEDAMFGYLCICVLSILLYYVHRVVSWYLRIVVIGTQVDKLPGDRRHWLYGNLKNVSGLFEVSLSAWLLLAVVITIIGLIIIIIIAYMGKGALAPRPWKCCTVFLCSKTLRRRFMHNLPNLSSVSEGFTPDPDRGSIPVPRRRTP